jgi:hypothetical protein
VHITYIKSAVLLIKKDKTMSDIQRFRRFMFVATIAVVAFQAAVIAVCSHIFGF